MKPKIVGYQNACTVQCTSCTDRNARRNRTDPFEPIFDTDATMVGQTCDKCGELLSVSETAVAQSLITLLSQAQEDVCSLHCPSVWKTGESQPHSAKCVLISRAIAEAKAALHSKA